MGKKSKKEAVKDSQQRMNFLYQAAHCMLAQCPDNAALARFYAETMRGVAAKTSSRLPLEVKRSVCKKCGALLVPGITATVRVRGRRQKRVVLRCLDCRRVKRFNIDRDHTLWVDRPEAVVTDES